MIWPFWVAAALPWSIGALGWIVRTATRHRDDARAIVTDSWCLYLTLWAVTPMLFFTPAGNILLTYVLPGLPAFALLVGELWRPADGPRDQGADAQHVRPAVRRAVVAGAAIPLLYVGGIVLLHSSLETERSQKSLVRDFQQWRTGTEPRLVYFRERPHSAEFYSRGKALKVPDAAALRPYLDDATQDFYAMRERDVAALAEADRARLQVLGTYGDYRLLREAPR